MPGLREPLLTLVNTIQHNNSDITTQEADYATTGGTAHSLSGEKEYIQGEKSSSCSAARRTNRFSLASCVSTARTSSQYIQYLHAVASQSHSVVESVPPCRPSAGSSVGFQRRLRSSKSAQVD